MTEINSPAAWLFILALPVACIAWTVTHEEIFSEINAYCKACCAQAKSIVKRKFFYVFTCEYCFSHYITAIFIALTGFKLLMDDWRGYVIAGFSVVWIANCYMSIYAWLRTSLKKERVQARLQEKELIEKEDDEE